MQDMEQLTGRMLGDYRLERLLGQSQLGAAYRAIEPVRGIRVMVTTFNFPEGQGMQEREHYRARFAREGATLTRLVHANIVPIYAFGEQPDYLYLVSAFVKEASLGQTLKQNTRFTPSQVLHVFQQLVAGLDYAHSQGIVHGMLSLANIIMNADQHVAIAGFGLHTMLDMHSGGQNGGSLIRLASGQSALLGSPEYISPERLSGLACDARADIYALGVMLFALLSGVQPFHGSTPLDIALQRLQQPAPQIHVVCPAVPQAFDLVIQRALERDPARRFQSASELLAAFERVVTMGDATQPPSVLADDQLPVDAKLTIPPTMNWFDEQTTASGKWKVVLPVDAGASIPPAYAAQGAPAAYSGTSAPDDAARAYAANGASGEPGIEQDSRDVSLAGIDPFAWWSSNTSGRSQPSAPIKRVPQRPAASGGPTRSQPAQPGRRKIVTLAVAGVAAASVLTIGSITFARLAQSARQTSQLANSPMNPSSSTTTPASSSTRTSSTTKPGTKPTRTTSNTPTTQKPTPTPKPTKAPTHSGTVIGTTALASNSSLTFTNPADGASSLLIHLSNGNFVACERACTHEQVPVNYDPGSRQIVCPAHGAVFNPLNGFSHVSGPGSGPLATVNIRVNGDGTITTG